MTRNPLRRLFRATLTVDAADPRTDTEQQDLGKVVEDMGVVKNALNEINSQLRKVHTEFTGKLDELLARETLDDEDRAALEELRTTAQQLDSVVPDAVTEPLPDPDTAPDAGGSEPVIDPAAPVDDTGAVDGGAEGDGAGTEPAVDAPAPSADDTTGEDVGPAVEEPAVGDATGDEVSNVTPADDATVVPGEDQPVAPAPADTGTVEEPPAPVTPEDAGEATPAVEEPAPAADDTATDSGTSDTATDDGGTTTA